MLEGIKNIRIIKKMMRSPAYCNVRQFFRMGIQDYVDDKDIIESDNAEIVKIDWPSSVVKPRIGIVRDFGPYPRWTKYRRFLNNNSFDFDYLNIHAHDWMEKAESFDVIIGIPSNDYTHLQEIRIKYHVLETLLGKTCYPSADHALLYENKKLEAYVSKVFDLPFVNTYISHDKNDALQLIEKLQYPVVSKIVPSAGSVGVELVKNQKQGRRIVEQAFSPGGRMTHLRFLKQKNYIYFQDYIPCDGYDIRAIVVGNWIFGYFRRVLEGDFRASGMNQIENKRLPRQAMEIALQVNKVINSPQLVVDMLHGLDGKYYIIEISPLCQMEGLRSDDDPGVFIFDNDGVYRFHKGKYWVQELALKEFLMMDYLPKKLR